VCSVVVSCILATIHISAIMRIDGIHSLTSLMSVNVQVVLFGNHVFISHVSAFTRDGISSSTWLFGCPKTHTSFVCMCCSL
jgi:hypothetical protein